MAYLTMNDGVKIYYEDNKKKGQTILIAHGLNSSSTKIKNFINEFGKEGEEYRVVYYDQRGHDKSDRANVHMNVKRLGQDINEIITSLDLNNIIAIGHSMGAASIFSYVNQFGCDKLKQIISVDMTPYMRNTVWEGGIGQGKWTDEDFLCDIDRAFDDIGECIWVIYRDLMNPKFCETLTSEQIEQMKEVLRKENDPLAMASLWYSLFRTDQRPAISKITVPFLYIMPEYPLYSMVTVNFIKENVKSDFVLEKDFPGTTHVILLEKPKECAYKIKLFIKNH